MEYNSIPDALQTRLRIAILSSVYNGEKDFNTLKEVLGVTDGNLSVQLMKLEQYGCLSSTKLIEGKKHRTVYSISDYGKKIFSDYVELLKKSMEESED